MPFGVDLGTTNSSIAWTDESGDVFSLRVRRGPVEPFDAIERSIVLDPEADDFVVGQAAVTEAARRRDREPKLVRSFKRRFDKQRLRQEVYRTTFQNTQDYDPVTQSVKIKESVERIPIFYDEYSRDEVVAAGGRLFNHLLSSAEVDAQIEPARAALSGLIRSAADSDLDETLYVGVPVAFGPTARRRLLAALVASGCFGSGAAAYTRVLKRCRLVYEPLALVSTFTPVEPQNLLVFDYGGGTLDLAVLAVTDFDERGSPIYKELALGGLTRAGDALDELFREKLLEQRPGLAKAFKNQIRGGSDYDVLQAEAAFANAKIRLSTHDAVDLPLFNEHVTREEFEYAVGPELEDVVASVHEALKRADLGVADVSTIILTGGSSLIPAVQARVRAEFEHIDDFSFIAGEVGDIDSAREALSGVSRGLARFGFLDRFETRAACDYAMVVPGTNGRTLCLPRGTEDVTEISRSPAVRVPVPDGEPLTFALYSNLIREAYCGALVDVALPEGADAAEVRVSASRDRFAPAFGVYAPGSRKAIARFDLDGMNSGELAAFTEGDSEWIPSSAEPCKFVLTKPLALGDFVEWQTNGNHHRRGKVIRIRDIASGEHVPEMLGFDPYPYVITVARELDGAVHFGVTTNGVWKIGEVRLA